MKLWQSLVQSPMNRNFNTPPPVMKGSGQFQIIKFLSQSYFIPIYNVHIYFWIFQNQILSMFPLSLYPRIELSKIAQASWAWLAEPINTTSFIIVTYPVFPKFLQSHSSQASQMSNGHLLQCESSLKQGTWSVYNQSKRSKILLMCFPLLCPEERGQLFFRI